jgi:hypothetical protein
VLLATLAFDPYHYAHYVSYDAVMVVWWKPAIAVLSAVSLAGVAYAAWHRRVRAARALALAEFAVALTLGLGVAHADGIRIALAGWPTAQVAVAAYGATLLLRGALVASLSTRPRAARGPAT